MKRISYWLFKKKFIQNKIDLLGILLVCILIFVVEKYNVYAQKINGEIIKVYDGDTITLLHNNQNLKIRLYGIDAPESDQSYGLQSQQYLLELCPLHTQATIIVKDKDKYNRIVGIVQCNGIDVNAKLVENSFAWAYREYSNAYTHLEIKARVEKKGLWNENNPIKPSEFRKNQKEKT